MNNDHSRDIPHNDFHPMGHNGFHYHGNPTTMIVGPYYPPFHPSMNLYGGIYSDIRRYLSLSGLPGYLGRSQRGLNNTWSL